MRARHQAETASSTRTAEAAGMLNLRDRPTTYLISKSRDRIQNFELGFDAPAFAACAPLAS